MPTFPCASPPFSKPVGPLVACPAPYPHYVIPCSHLLDPAYATQLNPNFPFPRTPRAWESETRAAGTGLIWGPQTAQQVCPPTIMPNTATMAIRTFKPPPVPPPMTPWATRAAGARRVDLVGRPLR